MGVQIDITVANWMASLIEPEASIPEFPVHELEREALQKFLEKLRSGYRSSPEAEQEFQNKIDGWLPHNDLKELVLWLRQYFGGRPWTALILPSGKSWEIDDYLSSERFLRRVVDLSPDFPGLILQMDSGGGALSQNRSLVNVFPAFRTALANACLWPGVLVWTRCGDSVFLPLLNGSVEEVERSTLSLFTRLYQSRNVNLQELRRLYLGEFPSLHEMEEVTLHVVQLSDLHIGSREADVTIPRVQRLVRNIVSELGERSRIAIVVSGDLMHGPRDRYLDGVRSFMEYLETLGSKALLAVPGNHDVRKQGWLRKNYQVVASGVPNVIPSGTVWIDECRVGFVCFNSVVEGKLARGLISPRQLYNLANQLEAKPRFRDYSLVAILHHHPVPVQQPDWCGDKPFYERILGRRFKSTECLKDADEFLDFVESRNMTAVLHGHKHIPRIAETPRKKVPILGCGSSVGKVPTKDSRPFMSINVLSLNTRRGQLSGRLLAELVPGGGPVELQYHEVLCRRAL